MLWCSVLWTGFGGPLCAKKSRAIFWPQSAPASEYSESNMTAIKTQSDRVNSESSLHTVWC